MKPLSVIILTFNESKHIERAAKSVLPIAEDVFVVDSGSTDDTRQIAEALGCKVLSNPWTNYATQLNWGLEHCPIKTRWVMRLDADEYISDSLRDELDGALSNVDESVTAFRIPRRLYFMRRYVKHGGIGERMMLRVWEHGRGRAEERWMDEHVVVQGGQTVNLTQPLIDDNFSSLTWWTQKHNTYASREAIDYMLRTAGHSEDTEPGARVSGQAARMRFAKTNLYYRLPPLIRPTVFFLFRYFVQLGFLDGISGSYFHFLQGWWYRMLVDAKIFEVRRYQRDHQVSLEDAVQAVLGFDVRSKD